MPSGKLSQWYNSRTRSYRFCYSPAFLRWALQPPGTKLDWLLGVRVRASRKLVGFISGVPADIRVDKRVIPMVEINFLCVHKKLRSKRLAPVLIKEITRRVNLHNIWQAAYTAGTIIPKPFATCRYWHRSLNPKKLIDVQFSRLAPRMTLARTIKLYKLPDTPATPGIRPLALPDVPQVTALLAEYMARFRVAPVLSEQDVPAPGHGDQRLCGGGQCRQDHRPGVLLHAALHHPRPPGAHGAARRLQLLHSAWRHALASTDVGRSHSRAHPRL
ncbi:glycylpeptide N-tetradecanoyltransferase [Haematococcus lacustris]|uniref:Glycylpeptide N-tetradecanoyltransferase n=1 Tax=Haematococcus lacustris TaxID=44745 RepID=A0A699ZUL8_HAELA|nr:glycylpeptide N-tetradecanoyltransferase [Haematococcus lacustris]